MNYFYFFYFFIRYLFEFTNTKIFHYFLMNLFHFLFHKIARRNASENTTTKPTQLYFISPAKNSTAKKIIFILSNVIKFSFNNNCISSILIYWRYNCCQISYFNGSQLQNSFKHLWSNKVNFYLSCTYCDRNKIVLQIHQN